MTYRFTLDNVLIQEPEGWDKFTTTISRDKSSNAILLAQSYDLTFGSTIYDYFVTQLNLYGFCGESSVIIEYTLDEGNTWFEFHRGVIYMADLKFDRKAKTVKAKVQDNSFYAYINNNKSLGVYIYGDKSKNTVSLTAIPVVGCQMFDPATGAMLPYVVVNGYEYAAYRVRDVLEFIVKYITDDKVSFASTCFDSGGEFESILMTTGYVLRWSNFNTPAGVSYDQFKGSWPQISFKELFDELSKRLNLVYYVDYASGSPVLRVEKAISSFSNSITPLSESLVDKVDISIDAEQLYSSVSLGTDKFDKAAYLTFPSLTPLQRFEAEKVTIQGQCNLNNTLDLTTKFIHDTNIIEDVSINGYSPSFEGDYDNEVFLIDATPLGGNQYQANRTNWISGTTPPFFYNERFNNYQVLKRFFPNINLVFASSNNVIAYRPAGTTPALTCFTTSPTRFSDDTLYGYDPSNSYGNGTSGVNITLADSRYTAQVADTYLHSFEVEKVEKNSPPYSGPIISLYHYDSANTLLNTYNYTYNSNSLPSGTSLQTFTFPAIAMAVGDYITVDFSNPCFGIRFRDDIGYMKWNITSTTAIQNEGQIYISNRTDNIYKAEFTLPMNIQDIITLKSNLPAKIEFEREGDIVKSSGWINSLTYNHKENQAKVVLISNKQDVII